jgi:hypothetical protein
MKKMLTIILISMIATAFAAHSPSYKEYGNRFSSAVKSVRPVMEYRVHRAGLFWLNTSNMGFFGEPWLGLKDPCTGKPAVSGEMPGGTGTEFLWIGALLFGGYLDSGKVSIGGKDATLFQGPLVTTAFEGWTGDPMPMEIWPVMLEDDPSGKTLGHITESSNVEGRLNCLFEDVYDPAATAEEQFNVMYSDKFVERVYTGMDDYDKREHIPLGIEIRQKSYAWSYEYAKKFIIIDYTLYNRNESRKDIYDFFMGINVDSDVGMKSKPGYYMDDLCGFIQKWDKYLDPATGEVKTVELNLAWSADNDGRDPVSFNAGTGNIVEPTGPLTGARGVAGLRVLRNPNPNLRYSFNIYVNDSSDESLDWGPRWKTGLHSDWQFDLTPKQKGYDDTNYDELRNESGQKLYGGRTEGRPIGDRGKYMVMSNDEFDYNQTQIREVYLGLFEDPDYAVGTWYAQKDKWQKWIAPGQEQGDEIPDGPISSLNNIANGMDERYLLSFGPLGNEAYEDIAADMNRDGVPETVIENKKVWKFAHGDSLKLTIAFIVNDNFNNSLDQDPNYKDDSIVDLSDGLDVSLYDKGWYDALYNVVWAERVYDIPMFDTPAVRFGETKTDGWYGEDVGRDGIFGDITGDKFCWWTDASYGGADEGEADFKLTDFAPGVTDIYGNSPDSEDRLLPFGNKDGSGGYGITGDAVTGEGYGYMVKYDRLGQSIDQGTWVRYGYDNGRLDPGDGVPDFTGPPPPPSPRIKVKTADNDIIIEWSSHELNEKNGYFSVTGPEHTVDKFSRIKDFEGYQVHISPDVFASNYSALFSVDRLNYSYRNSSDPTDYYDVPISADSAANAPYIIMREGVTYNLVPFGDNRNLHSDHTVPDLYTYTSTKDTVTIAFAPDSLVSTEIFNYRFVLHNKLIGKRYFVSVTATDFGDPKTGVPVLQSSPSINGTSVVTSSLGSQTGVVVVPNPYRGDAGYLKTGWETTAGSEEWKEQDRKIAFLNIPERCVIRIYTLAGDLVKTIAHNGNARYTDLYMYGQNGTYWNLINDNQQAVMSGIYLFSVQDVDKKKDDFVGKFVIIK